MANNYRTQYKEELSFGKTLLFGFLIAMVGTSIYFANYLLNRSQSLSTNAASGKANIFWEPTTATLPPNSSLNLWVTTDKQLGFSSTEISFDPTLVKMTQELTSSSPLTRIIKQTTMAEANKTGKLTLVVAMEPTALANAPTGSIKLASLKFGTVTTVSNKSTLISLNLANTQLVDSSGTSFTTTSTPLTLTLNPVTSTPTPQSSSTPIPSIISGSGPSITVKSPKEGESIMTPGSNGGLWIGSTVSDSDGIYQTNFYVDNTLVWTCGNQAICNKTINQSYAPGNHVVTIESIDNSVTKNKTIKKINVIK